MSTNDTFRFSSTRSYQLFHEGLDSLRSYEKGASNTELVEAEKHFRECVDAYPSDLLPRFYFAVVKTLEGYRGLNEAIEQFNYVISNGAKELATEAKYNLAIAYLQKYTPRDAEKANELLKETKQELARTLTSSKSRTLELQVRLIEAYLFVHYKLWDQRHKNPVTQDSELASEAQKLLDAILAECNSGEILQSLKSDLLADYYNTLATFWESLAWSKSDADKQQAATNAAEYFKKSLNEKPNWLPAKSNLARVYQELLGADDEALLLWDDVLKGRPDDHYTYYMKGQILETRQPKSLAIAAYRRAADYIASANLRLARLLEQIPDNASALKSLHKFLTFKDIREEDRREAEAAIERIQKKIHQKPDGSQV
jgi:hypothetical protein